MKKKEWSAEECVMKWHSRVLTTRTDNHKPYKKQFFLKENDISLSILQESYELVAHIVAKHGEVYLPIFERLHTEIEQRKDKDDMLAKARTIAVDKLEK